MTLPEITAVLIALGAAGATIKAGPSVWGFVRNVARIPSMVESIWREFGRNGGSSIKDRIEHIARGVDRADETAKQSVAMAQEAKLTLGVHLQADAASFTMIASANERVADRLGRVEDRLGRLEEAVAEGTRQEGEHADAAAANRNGSSTP